MARKAGYKTPPADIAALVDAPLTPSFSLDPTHRWALLLSQPAAPPIEELAREELKLAGVRLDPNLWIARGSDSFGYEPRLRRLFAEDGETAIPLGSEPDIPIEVESPVTAVSDCECRGCQWATV